MSILYHFVPAHVAQAVRSIAVFIQTKRSEENPESRERIDSRLRGNDGRGGGDNDEEKVEEIMNDKL